MDFLKRIFGKRTPQSSTQRDEPRALAAAQPKQTILFAFFVRATGGPRVISTSSQEAWVKRLRDALELPKAQVTMFQENQWDAPSLDSVDDKAVQKNLVKIRGAIHKALITQGVPAAVLNDLTSDIVKLSNPLTRLVVFVVKYTGDLPSASKTARSEKRPELLLLLVDREPPEGKEVHVRKTIAALPPESQPSMGVELQVTDRFEDANYIAIAANWTALRHGFEPDLPNVTWNSYTTWAGVRGTIVRVYRK